jgi:hypothetical protein
VFDWTAINTPKIFEKAVDFLKKADKVLPTMNISLESLVQKTFVGKIFLRSEFHDAGDDIYGLRSNEKICTIDDLIGKKIIYATPVSMQVRRGVGLQFEGVDFDELIGFYENCQITISD